MGSLEKPLVKETISWGAAKAALASTRIFAGTDLTAVTGVDRVERILAPAGAAITQPGDPADSYWVLLRGETRAERMEADGTAP